MNRARFLNFVWAFGLGMMLSAGAARAQHGDCAQVKNLGTASMGIGSAEVVAAGNGDGRPAEQSPEYCRILGSIHDRTGADGAHYAIQFELRLPASWNGRLFFQGGGGTDGVVLPAVGTVNPGAVPALNRGYAVVSTDAGHQGQGKTAFGHEQQARLDYAYNAIGEVTRAAKQLIEAYYGKPPRRAYFVGCSNGGRQAMMAVQRFPLEFDGAIAGDPGFRLSRAAIGEAWDTQTFAAIAPRDAHGDPILSRAFTGADLKLVSDAVLKKCDVLDGVKDGSINNMAECRFDPASLECNGEKTAACLSHAQGAALKRSFDGARDSRGNALYASWPYDAGIGDIGWRIWKLGTAESGESNALNATLGRNALLDYFVHPAIEGLNPQRLDYDALAAQVAATSRITDPTDTDISTFTGRGGRLLIYQGMSDPVFSANDIVAYYEQLERDNGSAEKTRRSVRLFLIPGMAHCGGGPSTDRFDPLVVLERWVEEDMAPEAIPATGRAFPGRTRPLCAYPRYAAYNGSGDPEDGRNFTCRSGN